MHATVFVKDEIHATGGTILVASAGKLEHDLTIDLSEDREELDIETTVAGFGDKLTIESTSPAWTGTTLELEAILNYIDIEDPPSGAGFYFQPGDVVRSKTEVPTGVTDIWLEITSATQWEGYARYGFIVRKQGFYNFIPAGAAVVSYGQPGDGRIMITSDLNYAPYLDVFTVGPEVWTGNAGSIVPHVRLGRLDGVGVPGVSGIRQYGIIAGTDLSNANSPYAIFSNLQLRLHKVNYTANNGVNDTVEITANGNLTLGSNIGVTDGKSFQVISTGADAGDVIIGRLSGNYLHWDQLTGTLTVNGQILVGGAPPVSKAYVDANDLVINNAATAAQGTANTANLAAGTAQGTANTAVSNAAAAQSTANTANSTANTALTNAATAQSTANSAANAAASAHAYAESHRIAGVRGTWTSMSSFVIQWSGVSISFANGVTLPVTNGSSGTLAAMTYFHVNPAEGATLTLLGTPSFGTIPAGNVLVTVATPGPTSADWATINVVGGATWISGDQIVTGSIKAAQIKAAAITTDRLAADVFVTTGNQAAALDVPIANTANTANANAAAAQGTANSANSAAATAQGTADSAASAAAAAQTTANNAAISAAAQSSYRALAVDGTFLSVDVDTISWSGVVVRKADGVNITVGDGNTGNLGSPMWLYIDHNATSPAEMHGHTSLGALPANAIIVGVASPGTSVAGGGSGRAGIVLLPGRTLITGDQIVTGSIVSGNIKAGAVTANELAANTILTHHIAASQVTAAKIAGANLSALKTDTGSLQVTGNLQIGTSGQINTLNKLDYLDPTPGVFLGWDTMPAVDAYTFAVGDSSSYLRWDGVRLQIRSDYPLDLIGDATGKLFDFHDRFGNATTLGIAWEGSRMRYDMNGAVAASGYITAPLLWANNQSTSGAEVLRFSMAGGVQRSMTFNVVGGGILSYSGAFHANGAIFSDDRFIQNGNIFQIKGSFKPANSRRSRRDRAILLGRRCAVHLCGAQHLAPHDDRTILGEET